MAIYNRWGFRSVPVRRPAGTHWDGTLGKRGNWRREDSTVTGPFGGPWLEDGSVLAGAYREKVGSVTLIR